MSIQGVYAFCSWGTAIFLLERKASRCCEDTLGTSRISLGVNHLAFSSAALARGEVW